MEVVGLGAMLQDMTVTSLRPLDQRELEGWFQDVAQLDRTAKALLESQGVEFVEATGYWQAGPTRVAAVELNNDHRFLLVEHVGHPDEFIDLRAEASSRTPVEVVELFTSAASLDDSMVTWTAERWDM